VGGGFFVSGLWIGTPAKTTDGELLRPRVSLTSDGFLTLATELIPDLDRPCSRTIHVSQAPMADGLAAMRPGR